MPGLWLGPGGAVPQREETPAGSEHSQASGGTARAKGQQLLLGLCTEPAQGPALPSFSSKGHRGQGRGSARGGGHVPAGCHHAGG